MKHIVKGSEPAQLRQWINGQPLQNGHRINCAYADMPGTVKLVVKQRLLVDQGGLCCYTGISITETSSHIEHFKPQSRCENNEDVAYANLLAAYPGDNQRRCQFGAHAKADWYDHEKLINPMQGSCERRFRFRLDGSIHPADPIDDAAKETIKRLCLGHDLLVEYRRQAIDAILSPRKREPSAKQLKQMAKTYCEKDKEQRYRPFCSVFSKLRMSYCKGQSANASAEQQFDGSTTHEHSPDPCTRERGCL
jgi:uncharacterized protein (TIGR02646 family)